MAVNSSMEKNLLLFGFSRVEHRGLFESLRARGFGIVVTASLSRLHITLPSRRFVAVLVTEAMVNKYRTPMARHLWESRSSRLVIVIRPSRGNEGGWDYTAYRRPEQRSGDAIVSAEPDALSRYCPELARAIRQAGQGAPEKSESVAEGATPYLPIQPGVYPADTFHRKMRCVFEAIVDSGEEGINDWELQLRLWPDSERDRRKDIQIYVSKIRKRLDSAEPNRFAIRYDKGRYLFADARRT